MCVCMPICVCVCLLSVCVCNVAGLTFFRYMMQSESLAEEGETNSKNPSPAYISALLLELLPCSGICISVPLNDIANCAELGGGGGGNKWQNENAICAFLAGCCVPVGRIKKAQKYLIWDWVPVGGPRREAGDVWCLSPVWSLRAVIWFPSSNSVSCLSCSSA